MPYEAGGGGRLTSLWCGWWLLLLGGCCWLTTSSFSRGLFRRWLGAAGCVSLVNGNLGDFTGGPGLFVVFEVARVEEGHFLLYGDGIKWLPKKMVVTSSSSDSILLKLLIVRLLFVVSSTTCMMG